MRFDEREAGDADADSPLFEDDLPGDPLHELTDPVLNGAHYPAAHHFGTTALLQSPPRRGLQRELRRKRRRRRVLLLLVVVLVAGIGGAGWLAYRSLYTPKDWIGNGTGQVIVQVHPGDGSNAIGVTLVKDKVVRSVDAYVSAAAKNSRSPDIAPGVYQLRLHMSAAAAVNLLLAPSAHIVVKVTVPEGSIEANIVAKLATALKVSTSEVQAAADDIANLGIPDGYAPSGGTLASAEGFLYPDTYSLDPGTEPAIALQQMAAEFTTEDKELGFADGAQKLGLTPYQALIIASIAQGEVKFDSDAPKVVRVILNRMATNTPLQIDATSVYAAELRGLDLTKVDYATLDSPYNSYLHTGLPPTPIGNPGEAMLQAAIAPAAGDWLYYVNGDAQGHLFFTNSVSAFEQAVARCKANNWGCA